MASGNLKLIYFGAFAGRVGPIVDALKIGKIAYEFEGLDYPTFGAQKAAGRFPLGSVPVLQIGDGPLIPQSNAILRYAGKLSGLYPEDKEEALFVDVFLDGIEESLNGLANKGSPEELKAIREKISAEDIPKHLSAFEKLIGPGGRFVVADKHTVADLKLLNVINLVQSGFLDHLSLDLAAYPKLSTWFGNYSTYYKSLNL